MPYTPTNYENTPSTNTPISAANLNKSETGIQTAQATAESAASVAAAALPTATAAELIRDTIGTALVAGTNITIVVNDAGDTITINATGGSGGLDTEAVQDAVAAMLVAGTNVSLVYNDTTGLLTVNSTGGGGTGTANLLVSPVGGVYPGRPVTAANVKVGWWAEEGVTIPTGGTVTSGTGAVLGLDYRVG